MSPTLKLSVVIPTYNRRELLSRTLQTVLHQHFPAEDYEVVVVVDGSTDGTIDMLRTFNPTCGFRVFNQPNRGQAAARNVGWKAALGELILFVDDDLMCDPTLLQEHTLAHDNST